MKRLTNSDFKSLFFKKEGRVIIGNKWINFYIVLIILFATFFALGIADGSKKYLEKRMDNPFNNWVNFETKKLESNELDGLIKDVIELKSKFHILDIDSLDYKSKYFFSSDCDELDASVAQRMVALSLKQSSSLFKDFLVRDQSFKESCKDYDFLVNNFDQSHGVIVKRKFLERLNYSLDSHPNYLKYYIKNGYGETFYASIPILAVVNDLPLNVSYACNKKTINYLKNTGFIKCDRNIYSDSEPEAKTYQIFVDSKVSIDDLVTYLNRDILPLNGNDFFESKFVSGNYYEIKDVVNVAELVNDVFNYSNKNIHLVRDYSKIRNWLESRQKSEFNSEFDYVSIQLTDLDSIKPLKKYLDSYPFNNDFVNKDDRLINIEIDKVESLSNLNFISELTKVLSTFLLFFSLFAIILFLVNIINSHFEKIKQNIGTLKAFGLSNKKLIGNYISIYMLIIFLAAIVAFLIAALLGQLGLGVLIFDMLDITIEKGEKCFDLINLNGLIELLLILTLSMGVVYFRLRKILLSTPGDLIFKR
tara:strand:+ start:772 stop:2370 length:1599 start_codon:yes stop_codon:yes gene_type:complete